MTQPPEPPRAPDGMQFNSPPGWPPPPAGWVPPPGFQPDPSWPPAPPGWQWWAPVESPFAGGTSSGSGWPGRDDTAHLGDTERLSATQAFGAPAFGATAAPPGYVGPPGQQVYRGPVGPPPAGPPSYGEQPPAGEQRSWVARHVLLTVALIVVVLLVLGGVATAGVLFVSNRGDDKQVAAGKSADPSPSSSEPEPSAQPSPSAPANSDSPEHKAACDKVAAPSSKAVALITALSTKSLTNSAIIAAIPPIQRDLDEVAGTTSGALARDLQEYSKALGGLRAALQQGKDPSAAAARVLIYSIILKAECAN